MSARPATIRPTAARPKSCLLTVADLHKERH
jgi:hypothetical protein